MICLDDFVGHQSLNGFDFLVVETSSNQTFDGIQSIVGIGDGLSFGSHTDQSLVTVGKGYDGRGGTSTFRVFNNTSRSSFHNGNTGVGGTQINTDHIPGIVRFVSKLLL
mmetsp:Transcript_14324/g.26830  ORF Transcript_14324/g.26830 Transcript_14324/m.26830 type:complete len:109 (-) Transcript_14324:181-507(-)